jgi:hypothetical protein
MTGSRTISFVDAFELYFLAGLSPIWRRLATTMLFFSFACHGTYMHRWGSIFIQDVMMPFRKKALAPDQHIRLLRWSVAFVAF